MSDEPSVGETGAFLPADAETLAELRDSCSRFDETWRILHGDLGSLPADDEAGVKEINSILETSSAAYELISQAMTTLISTIVGATRFTEIPDLQPATSVAEQLLTQHPGFLDGITRLLAGPTVTAAALEARDPAQRQAVIADLTTLTVSISEILTGLVTVQAAVGWPTEYTAEIRKYLWTRGSECLEILAARQAPPAPTLHTGAAVPPLAANVPAPIAALPKSPATHSAPPSTASNDAKAGSSDLERLMSQREAEWRAGRSMKVATSSASSRPTAPPLPDWSADDDDDVDSTDASLDPRVARVLEAPGDPELLDELIAEGIIRLDPAGVIG